MAELVWVAGEEEKAIAGLKAVRNDASDVDWAFITYAGNTGAASGQLKFGGQGSGGVDAAKGHFAQDNISFALVRVTDKIDLSVTVKFCWINYVGPKTPRMMQSKLSVQLGAVQAFFKPYSTDLSTNNIDEVSHAVIMEKVLAYSVSGSKVIDEQSKSASYRATAATAGTAKAPSHQAKMAEGPVTFADNLRAEINSIRSQDAADDYVVITYEDASKPHLTLLAKGSGCVAGLRSHLSEENVAYGLVRKIEKIDDTLAVKFCYIRWIGKSIPFMQRAKLGTHSGDIADLFTPYHTSLDAPDLDDVTDAKVVQLINNASGTAKHVLEAAPAPKPSPAKPQAQAAPAAAKPAAAPKPAAERKPAPAAAKEGEDVVIIGDGIREAIKDVRNDATLTDWALVSYDMGGKPQSKQLVLVGKGEGGLAELKSKLADEMVGYALYRTMEKVDDSETVKFVFIDWRGGKIHRMQRAILGTHQGAVRALFEPYHVDIDGSTQDEVTDALISAKIKKAAGTAVYVK